MKWTIDKSSGNVGLEGHNYISGCWYIKNRSCHTRKGAYELFKNGHFVKAFDKLKDAKSYTFNF